MEGRIWTVAKIGIGFEAPPDVKLKQMALMVPNRLATSGRWRAVL
jgi:hypothetical protein